MWPLAVVIIALTALFVFRAAFSDLLNRTKRIGAGSSAIDFSEPKTTEQQQIQAQPTPSQIPNYALGPPSPAVAEIERQIVQLLNSHTEDEESRKQRLIRGAATMAL